MTTRTRHKAAAKRANSKSKAKQSWLKTALFLSAFTLLVASINCFSFISVANSVSEKNHEIRLSKTFSFCESLFDENSALRPEFGRTELADCESRLTELENQNNNSGQDQNTTPNQGPNKFSILHAQIADAYGYLDWLDLAAGYVDENNIVKESINEQDLTNLSEKFAALPDQYHPLLTEKLDYLKSEYDAMHSAEDAVNKLFTSPERTDIRTNATRAEYNDAKSRVDNLKQENLKNDLSDSLEKVLKSIEEQERIAWERAEQARKAREEEQRKIAESWHRLDIYPYYINQFSAGIYNGCEAASLLMALKYKGYLRGTDFRSFAMNMPTADDPNQGFYLSMTELEPKTEAHWIAPAPLARYGMSASGASVANVSGYSLDQLDNEVKNGNPVVIYLTYGLKNPKDYSKGVPKNLHVMVLAGFNSYTGEQQIYDPWPVVGGASTTISKSLAEYLYNASGRRAVVVR